MLCKYLFLLPVTPTQPIYKLAICTQCVLVCAKLDDSSADWPVYNLRGKLRSCRPRRSSRRSGQKQEVQYSNLYFRFIQILYFTVLLGLGAGSMEYSASRALRTLRPKFCWMKSVIGLEIKLASCAGSTICAG